MFKIAAASALSLALVSTATAASADPAAAAPNQAATPQTLFHPGDGPEDKVGWYLAPTSGFTSFDGHLGYVAGLRGAVLVNRTWGFGLAGNFLTTNHTSFSDDRARNVGGYGGGYVQYILRSNDVVHAFADMTAGGGFWCSSIVDSGDQDGCIDKRRFSFIEPTVNVELNVFKWMRLSTGVGYRAAIAEDGPGLGSRQLSGVVARSSLVFGMF
jgi:hypothetical protein